MTSGARTTVAGMLDKLFLALLGGVIFGALSHTSGAVEALWVVLAMAAGFGGLLLRPSRDRPLDGTAALIYRSTLMRAAEADPEHCLSVLQTADAAAGRCGYLLPESVGTSTDDGS